MPAEYPEHQKLQAISDESQAIGEFIENGGFVLCTHREAGDNGEPLYVWCDGCDHGGRQPTSRDYYRDLAEENPAYESWYPGYVPVGKPINELLADYFGIDLAALEREKRQMLDAVRRRPATTEQGADR